MKTLSPIAVYIGEQATFGAPIALFNLLAELPGHPVDSTVSKQTLEQNGIKVPSVLVVGQAVTGH